MTDVAEPTGCEFTVAMHDVAYEDPFANEHQGRIEKCISDLERVGRSYYKGVSGLERKRLSAIDHSNPATVALLDKYTSFGDWLEMVPSAAALDPLYDPSKATLANGVEIEAGTREWFNNIADAWGIRSRASVLADLLLAQANSSSNGSRWLSLACGAAQPIFQVMRLTRDQGLPAPRATLADLDRSALRLARRYAKEGSLTPYTTLVRANVLDPRGFTKLANTLGWRTPSDWLNGFDAVDAVGLLEYLKPDDWTYTYKGVISSKRKLAGAITFLRNAFACVKPGGVLIVGNMLDTHPQLGFTLDVVQWPHIQPRSVETMLKIFRASGLSGHVDVYLPSDGVYAVYAVCKQ